MRKRAAFAVGVVLAVPLIGVGSAAFAEGTGSSVSTSTVSASATAPSVIATAPSPSASSTGATPVTATPATVSPVATSQPTTPATTPAFEAYTTSQDWYKSGGNVATGDIWPQLTTPITCGGIVQHDVYTITSQKMSDDYKALIASGVLASSANDAEFSPHDYTVTQLPACDVAYTPVAPIVTSACGPADAYYMNTVHLIQNPAIHWVLDGSLGQFHYTAVANPGFTIVGQSTWFITPVSQPEKKCTTAVVPPVKPVPPITKPSGPSTPTAPTKVSSPTPIHSVSVKPATSVISSASPATSRTTLKSLAFTGQKDNTDKAIIASAAIVLGVSLLVGSMIWRKKVNDGR